MFIFLVSIAAATGPARLQALAELRAEAPSRVIEFDAASYKEYAVKYPKPYQLFVLFTADHGLCRVCANYEQMFAKVADSAPEVFFAKIDGSKNPRAMELHEMTTVPVIAHYTEDKSFLKKKGALTIKPQDSFPIMKMNPEPQELLDWVNAQLGGGSEIRLRVPLGDRIYNGFLIFGVVGFVALFGAWLVSQVRKRRWVLVTIPLIIQYVSTSGLFYNILQGMQMFGPDGSWIMKSSRGQYLSEGLAMSACMSFTGLALLAAVKLPNTALGRKMNVDFLSLVMIALAVIGSVLISVVLQVYKVKTGWYQDPPFFPPEWYRRGPISVDQGNSL